MPLNEEQIQRNALLAKELRETAQEQGMGRLIDSEGCVCCLKLACDVYQRETRQGSWTDDCSFVVGRESYEYARLYPPPPVAEWFGWKSISESSVPEHFCNPILRIRGSRDKLGVGQSTATHYNDSGLFTFAEIANGFEVLR